MIDNKTKLIGLVMECPFGIECSDCPLQQIRDLKDFEKQIDIIDNMTQTEIDEFIKHHKSRRFQREKDEWILNHPTGK